jgi:hypothetical protein
VKRGRGRAALADLQAGKGLAKQADDPLVELEVESAVFRARNTQLAQSDIQRDR